MENNIDFIDFNTISLKKDEIYLTKDIYIKIYDNLIISNLIKYLLKKDLFEEILFNDELLFDFTIFIDLIKSLLQSKNVEYFSYSTLKSINTIDNHFFSESVKIVNLLESSIRETIVSNSFLDNPIVHFFSNHYSSSVLDQTKSTDSEYANSINYVNSINYLFFDKVYNTFAENEYYKNHKYDTQIKDSNVDMWTLYENSVNIMSNAFYKESEIMEKFKSYLINTVKDEIQVNPPVQNITKNEYITEQCEYSPISTEDQKSIDLWNNFMMSLELEG